jgi:hypothetical protein
LILGGCTSFDNQSFWEVSYVDADFEAGNFKTTRLGIQGTSSLSMLFGMGNTGIALGSTDMLKQCMDELHQQYPLLGKSAPRNRKPPRDKTGRKPGKMVGKN